MTFCKCPADRALSGVVGWPVYTKCVLKRRASVRVLSHMVMTSWDLLPHAGLARDCVTRGGRDNCIISSSSRASNEGFAKLRRFAKISQSQRRPLLWLSPGWRCEVEIDVKLGRQRKGQKGPAGWFAVAAQFHIYLPWGQCLFSLVSYMWKC